MTLLIITFFDELVVTEDDNTNVVGLQVEGHALEARAEGNHSVKKFRGPISEEQMTHLNSTISSAWMFLRP